MATDISNYGTILAKGVCISTICGGNDNGNGNVVIKPTNAGNENDAALYTFSKNADGTSSMTGSLPTKNITDFTGIARATASALQNGAQGVVTNIACNAEVGKYQIDATAMENPTFDVMAGDLVQLYQGNTINPTIEMYHQPPSSITGEDGIEEFSGNPTWTFTTHGTTVSFAPKPLTITREIIVGLQQMLHLELLLHWTPILMLDY